MRTLVLTGPPGAGKTSTFSALMGALEAQGVSYAAVEVEALALVHPWPDDDAAFDHLRFVASSFEQRGYPLLLLTATVTDAGYLERLRAALPGDDVVLVALTAAPALLQARIAEREPADWVGLPRLLAAIPEIADATLALPGVDLALDTGQLDLADVVAAVRDLLATP